MFQRPRTKPKSGKRREGSSARTYCHDHPGDPSCYYPAKGADFRNNVTNQMVAPGCIGGVRGAAGNPPGCDFRRVKSTNQANLPQIAQMRRHFNRARIEYANSQALLQKYSPFQLTAQGWPNIPNLTDAQCAAPGNALIAQLNGRLREPGAQIWLDQRQGTQQLKCNQWKMPKVRWGAGRAERNRYFQMGVSYSYKAMGHFLAGFNLSVAHPEQLSMDETDAILYVMENDVDHNSSIQEWRKTLAFLRPATTRRDAGPGPPPAPAPPAFAGAPEVVIDPQVIHDFALELQQQAEAASLMQEIQEAAAAAAGNL